MKYSILLFIFSSLVIFIPAQNKKIKKKDIKTEKQKVSYSIGYDIGRTIKMQQLEVEEDLIYKGISDALKEHPLFSEKEMNDILVAFHSKRLAEKEKVQKQQKEKNIKEGENFLAANKKKKGVITLPSGLQYKIIKKGKGPSPTDQSKVTVNYKGYFINGDVFDSSYDRKEPISFPVLNVIPGWTEALKLMHVGAKWQLFIPYKLAYGENGQPPKIGPAKTLLFDVELLSIDGNK